MSEAAPLGIAHLTGENCLNLLDDHENPLRRTYILADDVTHLILNGEDLRELAGIYGKELLREWGVIKTAPKHQQ